LVNISVGSLRGTSGLLAFSRPWPMRWPSKENQAPDFSTMPALTPRSTSSPSLGDALAVHDVELDLAERRRDLVLDDLHAGLVADDLVALLDRADAADVEADRGVELQRVAAGGRLGEPNMTPIFMRIWLMKMTMSSTWRSSRSACAAPGSSGGPAGRAAVAHLALDLGLRRQRRDRVDHETSTAPERTSVSVISSACSPVSGCETSRSSRLTPSLLGVDGSSACSASTKAQTPPAFCASATVCSASVVLPEDSGP
jgi:hypothetical protein